MFGWWGRRGVWWGRRRGGGDCEVKVGFLEARNGILRVPLRRIKQEMAKVL